MKIQALFIAYLLTLSNMADAKIRVPKYIIRNFSNCIDDDTDRLSNKLNVDGFFRVITLEHWCNGYGSQRQCHDSSIADIIFYKNGLYLFGFSGAAATPIDSVRSYLKSEYLQPKSDRLFVSSGTWGVCKVIHDTLILQSIYNAGAPIRAAWRSWEEKYHIVDRNTIEWIPGSSRALYKQDRQTKLSTKRSSGKTLPAKFISCGYIPPPNCWLTKQSWVWCKNKQL